MLEVVSQMNRLNDDELNNLIYVFLKYTFKFESPDNSDIAAIMKVVGNNRDRSVIIQETSRYVSVRYGRQRLGDLGEMLKHMNFVFDEFPNLPHSLRNSLGEDADDFMVKN